VTIPHEPAEYVVVVATDAEAAMRFFGRSDRPVNLGPPANPERYKPGARRWGFRRVAPDREAANAAVIAKVRKLLALADDAGATEGEATNAAAAAQRLIELHRLDVATLEAGEGDAPPLPEETIVNEPLIEGGAPTAKRIVSWRGQLTGGIAKSNGCRHYWHVESGKGVHLRIVGPASRLASVRYLYAYLSHEIDRLGTEAARGNGRAYGNAWRLGCAQRVSERLRESVKAARVEARTRAKADSGAALARLDNALARIESDEQRVLEALRKLRLVNSPTKVGSASGYEAGKAAGNRIQLGGHAALGRGAAGKIGRGQ
jgi:hypothetical protein